MKVVHKKDSPQTTKVNTPPSRKKESEVKVLAPTSFNILFLMAQDRILASNEPDIVKELKLKKLHKSFNAKESLDYL